MTVIAILQLSTRKTMIFLHFRVLTKWRCSEAIRSALRLLEAHSLTRVWLCYSISFFPFLLTYFRVSEVKRWAKSFFKV